MRRRNRLGPKPVMMSPYFKNVLNEGLKYTRANYCPWAGVFMSVKIKDRSMIGRLVGFIREDQKFRARVAIGKTTYIFDLNQIDWPQDDPLKGLNEHLAKVKREREHG